MKKMTLLGLAATLLIMASASAQTNPTESKSEKTFYFNDPAGRNSVTFKSTAPLEDIVGTTNQITGFVFFDPSDPESNGHGEFNVPVAKLNTGIPLRNEHMQSKAWLDAETYPNIALKISKTDNIKEISRTESSVTYDLTLFGDFTVHGITNKIQIQGRITYLSETEKTKTRMEGNLLAARANFDIALADYGITGPPGMGIVGSKVGEKISVEISIMGSDSKTMALETEIKEGEKTPSATSKMNSKQKAY